MAEELTCMSTDSPELGLVCHPDGVARPGAARTVAPMTQPISDMAGLAAQRLFGRISGTITGPAEVLVSQPALLVRESTRPLVD